VGVPLVSLQRWREKDSVTETPESCVEQETFFLLNIGSHSKPMDDGGGWLGNVLLSYFLAFAKHALILLQLSL
jgi:hypothetical protein